MRKKSAPTARFFLCPNPLQKKDFIKSKEREIFILKNNRPNIKKVRS